MIIKKNKIYELPLELLWEIFQYLSQNDLIHGLCVSKQFHSFIVQFKVRTAIQIHSSNQLIKFIATANKLHVYNVVLHFPIDNHTTLLSNLLRSCSNIKSVTSKAEVENNPYLYSIVKTPTSVSFNHIPFWYLNSYIKKINEKKADLRLLRSLQYNFALSSSSESSIYLTSTGSIKTKKNRLLLQNKNNHNHIYHHNNREIRYRIKTIVMPLFHHLIKLNLALKEYPFYPIEYEYELDQTILEKIHSSCPVLVELFVSHYYMNISDEFDEDLILLNSSKTLKKFGMTGSLFDSRCCRYFCLKYPYLVSFEYIYSYKNANDYPSQYLQPAFSDMIHQLSYLKQLHLRTLSYDTDDSKFWPVNHFIQFLNNQPDQLTELDYPCCLFPIPLPASNPIGDHPPYNINNMTISNGLFLKNLSVLNIKSKPLLETAINYLIYKNNDDTMTISKSIKQLTVYDNNLADSNGLYLFDLLVLFPSLDILKIEKQVLLDEADDDDKDDDISNQYKNNDSSKVLNLLIDERKRQHGGDYNKTGLYKLYSLEINHTEIRYVNGFTSFFENFNKLQRLILSHIHYSFFEWKAADLPENITSISLDMCCLSLDYILITDIRVHSWLGNTYYLEKLVKKTDVIEHSTGRTRSCHYETPSGKDPYLRALSKCHPNNIFVLNLSCHYLEQFVYY